MSQHSTIATLGERGLLALIEPWCDRLCLGDDAAILPPSGDRPWVVTTDVLVGGVHFSDRTTPPEAVGWRAMAANLSDLAAMGATAMAITVGLALPPDTPIAWVEGLYRGMRACGAPHGVGIVGGDLCRSSVPTVAITAIGWGGARAIRRSAAQPGDCLVVTGFHGDSRGGLAQLLAGEVPVNDRLIQAHQYPQPRLDLVPWLLAAPGDRDWGGMDSSDGLADAVVQICEQSGSGARIAHLPISPELRTYAGDRAADWCLYGGEDFQLVLALPPTIAESLLSLAGPGAMIIGEVVPGDRGILWDSPQGAIGLDRRQGFQHFSPHRQP